MWSLDQHHLGAGEEHRALVPPDLLKHHLHLDKIPARLTCTLRSEKQRPSPRRQEDGFIIPQAFSDFSAKSRGESKELTRHLTRPWGRKSQERQ